MTVGSKTQKNKVKEALATCRGAFVSIGMVSCLTNLLVLTGPLFMLQIYDRVLTSRSLPTLAALAGLVLVMLIFYGLFEFLRRRILVRVARQVEEQLRADSYELVMERQIQQDEAFGLRPIRDLGMVRRFMTGNGLLVIFDIPWSPIFLIVIFFLHPLLGIAASVAAFVMLILAVGNDLVTRKPLAEAQGVMQAAQTTADEHRDNAEVIRSLGMAEIMRERWRAQEGEAQFTHSAGMDRATVMQAMSKALRLIFQACILGLGAWLAVMQEISAGTIVAGSIIMARALAPIDQAVSQWPSFMSYREAMKRLRQVFDMVKEAPTPIELPAPKGRLSVNALTCFSPQTRDPIITNVTFNLTPGQVLGVIGPSGAGKSTLVRAVMGVWPVFRGEVRLDGALFDQYQRDPLGRWLGYLPQDASLMSGTIAQNISRFYPDADEGLIIEAAKAAGIHDLVLSLPAGYQTHVGERGTNLSAGQRQRIALARAIYGHPKLVVMDEPNSNLDSEGEAALVEAIKNMRAKGVTVIVVAHRPSALAVADLILVLIEGQVAAFGDRDEVLQKYFRPVRKVAAEQKVSLVGSD